MLSREVMGLLALGILWLNSGLVLVVALKQLGNVLALGRQLREGAARGELVRGEVVSGGRLALRRVHQTGRAMTTRGPDRVLFTDGPQSFEVCGGVVREDGGDELEVEEALSGAAEVWVDEARERAALECPSAAEFEAAWRPANTHKGHAREVDLEVREGDRVWILGRRDGDRLGPWEQRPMIVSMIDPAAWVGGRVRLLVGFVAGALALLIALTGVALWPPVFGVVSTIGGALCVAYFLAIQPLGTAVRDAVRTPGRRMLGAAWTRPGVAPDAALSSAE